MVDVADTRALYHALLPTELLDDEFEAEGYTLAEKAEIAIAARRAARLYARERALLPVHLCLCSHLCAIIDATLVARDITAVKQCVLVSAAKF